MKVTYKYKRDDEGFPYKVGGLPKTISADTDKKGMIAYE